MPERKSVREDERRRDRVRDGETHINNMNSHKYQQYRPLIAVAPASSPLRPPNACIRTFSEPARSSTVAPRERRRERGKRDKGDERDVSEREKG